jgi:light-regulated signal transduction histidine kinase (bacteriophytochrome)
MPGGVAPADASVLWLAALQRALARASHDVKDALNGVSVNLEVVRSRAARPDAPASAVASFADAAAQQLERLTSLLDTVLALGRAERDPVDVGITLRRVAALCGASSAAADSGVSVHVSTDGVAHTRVVGDAVRLALAAPLLDAVVGTTGGARATDVACDLTGEPDALVVRMHADRAIRMPADVAETLRAAGVRWTEASNDLSLVFPRA